jgi:hypothetical protein
MFRTYWWESQLPFLSRHRHRTHGLGAGKSVHEMLSLKYATNRYRTKTIWPCINWLYIYGYVSIGYIYGYVSIGYIYGYVSIVLNNQIIILVQSLASSIFPKGSTWFKSTCCRQETDCGTKLLTHLPKVNITERSILFTNGTQHCSPLHWTWTHDVKI